MVKIIGDPGSCHMGQFKYGKELINIAIDCGIHAVKFQLFPDILKFTSCGNIPLSQDIFIDLVDYGEKKGMEVFASVFDQKSFDAVASYCKSIKIAYSVNMKDALLWGLSAKDKTVYVSCDMTKNVDKQLTRLYCIPEYPVKYIVDFEGLFGKDGRFDGFSDHTMGIGQTRKAITCGAKIIEKHFRLDNSICDSVPDGAFAIRPKQLKELSLKSKDV